MSSSGPGQVDPGDVGLARGAQAIARVPEPADQSGPEPAGSSGALHGRCRRSRAPDRADRRRGRRRSAAPCPARVHDGGDVGDGERGLGEVGGEDDAPSIGGAGRSARSCAAASSQPCSGTTCTPATSRPGQLAGRRLDLAPPGRKQRTPPRVRGSASAIAAAGRSPGAYSTAERMRRARHLDDRAVVAGSAPPARCRASRTSPAGAGRSRASQAWRAARGRGRRAGCARGTRRGSPCANVAQQRVLLQPRGRMPSVTTSSRVAR